MKHLRQYNEDVENQFEFDEEYIRECFIEFYDDAKYDITEQYDTNSKYVEYGLGIDCPDLKIEAEYNVDNFIKMSEELSDFYKELEVSIEKVKIKYPDIDVVLFHDNHPQSTGVLRGTRFVWVKFRKNI